MLLPTALFFTLGCVRSSLLLYLNKVYTTVMKSYKDSARLQFAIKNQKINPRILNRELLRIFFHSLLHHFACNLIHVFQMQSGIWLCSVKLVCNAECCLCYKVLTAGISFPQNLVQLDLWVIFLYVYWIFHCLWDSKDVRWNRGSPKYWFFFLQRGITLLDISHCK